APAVHLSAHEAAAWCRFAGRRLPSEVEFETAVRLASDGAAAFECGQVWEWTASKFKPYAGFAPHPYRDYSAPFF
ncbi:MAG: SUMF1/EgtB/PvdO family nonheme iron enzyme, partial [Giesbergeria sp.]